MTKKYWVEQLGEDWALALKDILKSDYMIKLQEFLTLEYTMQKVHPNKPDIFNYFRQPILLIRWFCYFLSKNQKIVDCIYFIISEKKWFSHQSVSPTSS